MASSWRSSRYLRSGTAADLNELLPGGGDSSVASQTREQSPARAGADLERLDAPGGAELRERDTRKRLGRIRENAQTSAVCRKRSQRRTRLAVGTEEDRRPVFRKALERAAPVAHAALGPAVEPCRRCDAILRQLRGVERRDRGEAACGVGNERLPEGPRVAERSVEVDGDRPCHGARRAASTTPRRAPAVSTSQSSGEPWRPATNA